MEQTEIAREQELRLHPFWQSRHGKEKSERFFMDCVGVYLCGVWGISALYFHNYYYDILVSKYQFYWLSTVAMLASCLIAAIVFACMDLSSLAGRMCGIFFARFDRLN